MNFRIGQRVGLVDDHWTATRYSVSLPRKGAIYTIRAIGRGDEAKGPWLLLNEIVNEPCHGWLEGTLQTHEPVFSARRFRPLVERKADISIFTAMLSPKPLVDA